MTEPGRHVVVGTAGHIDHGKSTLIRALTGIDPDRLQEEKERGITIDLGFAHMRVGEVELAFVDVPGHERFVHNMLAGATGIDVLLFVVAADESVMPQTREHLGICRLLGIRAGVIALTRIDRADPLLVEVAAEEVGELVAGTFLAEAPVVRVSGTTGEGLDALREALASVASRLPESESGPWFRLPIDRAFAVRGFGTVVTGTLHGAPLTVGDAACLAPGGARTRVRGLQVHGENVARVEPPRRVAVNLHGVELSAVERGMTLVPPACGVATRVFDASLDVLPDASAPLQHRQRVRVHHGTDEVMARLRLPGSGVLEPGARGAAQIRLERELAILPGDAFIVRRYSPVATLAGGRAADIDPLRFRRGEPGWAERVRAAAEATPEARWEAAARDAREGLTPGGDARRLGLLPEAALAASSRLANDASGELLLFAGRRLVAAKVADARLDAIAADLDAAHARDPLAGGLAAETLRTRLAPAWETESFRALLELGLQLGLVELDGEAVRRAGHDAVPTGEEARLLDELLARLGDAGLDAPTTAELDDAVDAGGAARGILEWADRAGRAVRLGADRWVAEDTFRSVVSRLRLHAEEQGPDIDVPAFKNLFGLTRKTAIPLLERLDDEGVTRRAGDRRRVLRSGVDESRGS